MARMYIDRYPDILDWANIEGKTAIHVAALKGNEELVRVSLWRPSPVHVIRPQSIGRCSAIWAPTSTSLITRETRRYTSEHSAVRPRVLRNSFRFSASAWGNVTVRPAAMPKGEPH